MNTLSPTLATDASPMTTSIITVAEIMMVIKALADRRDPYNPSIANLTISNRTVEVLITAASLVESITHSQTKRGQDDQRGVPWTSQEDQHLQDAFQARELTARIAERHRRTSMAIRSRLVKLGLLSQNEDYA